MKKRTILTKCAILLGGLYATGLSLWHLGNTVVFVCKADRVPGIVVDVKERPFDGVVEMLQHGNMPWEGAIAYQPYVRYELFGHPVMDDSLPDLDNRNYANGQAVDIILDPANPFRRHLYSAKFLWVGDLLLLAAGALLLMLARYLLRRRRKQPTATAKQKSAPAPAKPLPAPAPAPQPAPAAEDFKLEAEPPAPKKRRRKAPTSGASKSSGSSKTTSRSRKKTDSADKPKTPRRRKKAQDPKADA